MSSHVPLKTHRLLFKEIGTHVLRRNTDKKGRVWNGWEGVIRSLMSATFKVNFDSLKSTWLLSCGVQLVSSF